MTLEPPGYQLNSIAPEGIEPPTNGLGNRLTNENKDDKES